MKKTEKVSFVIDTLESIYPTVPIPLDHSDNYTLLVAVLLSAQCTDKRVNIITPGLFKAGPTPEAMAKLSIPEIKELIKTCGLANNKSKAIYNLSNILVDKYAGEVPEGYEALESLPGVGHKTASVVMSQGFGHPAFPVDTHIHRLMYRWGLSTGKNVAKTEEDAKRLFPKEIWNKLHLQIIYYGREYSPAGKVNMEKDIITQKIGRKGLLTR